MIISVLYVHTPTYDYRACYSNSTVRRIWWVSCLDIIWQDWIFGKIEGRHSLGTAHIFQTELPSFSTCSSKMTPPSSLTTFMKALQHAPFPRTSLLLPTVPNQAVAFILTKHSSTCKKPVCCPSRWTESTIANTAPSKKPVCPLAGKVTLDSCHPRLRPAV